MTSRAWRDAFTNEEIQNLRKVSDLHGALMLATNWGLIVLALGLVAAWPHPLTGILSVFILGARQLGLAVIMHEASHRTLFSSRRLNDWAGNWLAAYWVFLGVELYRPYHLQHHAHTGTERDPDLGLRNGYPATRASMARKVARDLSGIVGFKRLFGTTSLLLRTVLHRPTGPTDPAVTFMGTSISRRDAARALAGFATTQTALVLVLWSLGHAWLYAIWAVAWLTTQSLVTRLRSIGEHAMTELSDDPFRNTRTIRTRWWERLFIAPNGVAFHLEHHLLMTVPMCNLPKLHRMLHERGLLDDACIDEGYTALLRRAVSA